MFKLNKILISLVLCSVAAVSAFAQKSEKVTGIVKDTDGQPMVGVTIFEKGTNNGVTSSVDGSYSIVLHKDNSSLVFSSLCYMTLEEPVQGRNVINAVLKDDALALTEAVVTGYGQTVSKDKLTAAISKVSSDEIGRGSHGNALSSLSGTVTGVLISSPSGQPGRAPIITIRGGAALDGSGSPLYIVDGVQKPDMSDINSNDIESVEMLKDAAATALYGAKANAGVVMVTTKQGREGRSEITFKANVGIGKMRETYEFLDADDYLYYLRLASFRSGNTAALSAPGPYGTGNVYESDGNKSVDGIYSTMFLNDDNRFLLDQGYKSMIDPITAQTIIYKEFTPRNTSVRDVAVTQDYNISASGGNSKGKYYMGIGYYNEQGFPIVSDYERISALGNASYAITPWLESRTNLSFSRADSHNVKDYIGGDEKNFFGIMYSAPPTMRQFNPAGEEIICTTNWENGNWDAAKDFFYRRHTNYRMTLSESLKFDITRHLYFKLNATWYLNMTEVEKANKKYLSKPGNWNSDRGVSNSYSRRLEQTYNAIVGYENSWGDHNFSVIGGYEFFDRTLYGTSAYGQGADSDDFISISNFDKTEDRNIAKIKMDSSHSKERTMSFFANAMYDYKSKYLVSLSARYDGYSKLVNNKWGFFPGVSLAWNIHKEDFMKNSLNWLSRLKLRTGFGQNGNVNLRGLGGPYDLQGNYGKTPNYDGEYGILINKLPYPDLRWEKTTSVDVAVEATFLDRINLSLGYYNKLTSDLLATVPYPSSSGVANQYTNNGSVKNWGIEMELGATLYKDRNWNVYMGANATYMRAKTIQLPDNGIERNRQGGQEVYDPVTGDRIWVGGYQEGQEYGVMYAHQMVDIVRSQEDLQKYAWYKDVTPKKGTIYGPAIWNTLTAEEQAKGQLLAPGDAVFYDVNGDKVIDQYDKLYMGNTIPRWIGGLNFNVSWKGLSLYAKFDYAGDYVGQNSRKQWYMACSQGTFNTISQTKDSWSPERPDATYPIFMYADGNNKANYRMSNLFIDDCSYLCARDITLSYSFPKKLMKKVKIQDLTFSVTGQNLFYITKTDMYSPEYGANSNGGYGTPRTVLFGIKATF